MTASTTRGTQHKVCAALSLLAPCTLSPFVLLFVMLSLGQEGQRQHVRLSAALAALNCRMPPPRTPQPRCHTAQERRRYRGRRGLGRAAS